MLATARPTSVAAEAMAQTPGPDLSLHHAARDGDTETVQRILRVNPKLATRRDDDQRMPIHWAASGNHLEIVDELSQLKGIDIDVQDDSGWSPLLISSSVPEGEDVVDLLLHRGADANLKSYSGQTALHLCVSKANLPVATKLIAQNASVRTRDKRGQLALHRAAAIGSIPIIDLLIAQSSPLNATDAGGSTALHHAVAEGHGDAALALLKAGAESHKRDGDDFLAIDLAPDLKIRKFILQEAEREGIEVRTQ